MPASKIPRQEGYAFRKIVALVAARLVTRERDGYVAITLPRDEPNASPSAVLLCDPCDPLASVCAASPRKPLRTRMRKAHTDDSARPSTGTGWSKTEPRWSLCPKQAHVSALTTSDSTSVESPCPTTSLASSPRKSRHSSACPSISPDDTLTIVIPTRNHRLSRDEHAKIDHEESQNGPASGGTD